MNAAFWIARIVLVLALVCVAALLATPPGRVPLALRGLAKIVRRDRGLSEPAAVATTASPLRRALAFLLVLVALVLAVL